MKSTVSQKNKPYAHLMRAAQNINLVVLVSDRYQDQGVVIADGNSAYTVGERIDVKGSLWVRFDGSVTLEN